MPLELPWTEIVYSSWPCGEHADLRQNRTRLYAWTLCQENEVASPETY